MANLSKSDLYCLALILAKRFWSKVGDTSDPQKCWEWQACKSEFGHGVFKFNDGNVPAHRHSYFIEHEAMPPEGMIVRHTCDNPACVNPAHLVLGTHADNVADRQNRGRSAIGEKSGLAKLTEVQVADIRRRHAAGETNKEIAKHYGMHDTTISAIVRRKIWRHAA